MSGRDLKAEDFKKLHKESQLKIERRAEVA